jgi:hypothetical protein
VDVHWCVVNEGAVVVFVAGVHFATAIYCLSFAQQLSTGFGLTSTTIFTCLFLNNYICLSFAQQLSAAFGLTSTAIFACLFLNSYICFC